MCRIRDEHEQHVTKEKSKRVLYLVLNKALRVCAQSALLWCELLAGTLIDVGFTLNPCELCFSNFEIERSQFTIVWHVDDDKISHKNVNVAKNIVWKLEEKFGKMSFKSCGSDCNFLGMKLSFIKK